MIKMHFGESICLKLTKVKEEVDGGKREMLSLRFHITFSNAEVMGDH